MTSSAENPQLVSLGRSITALRQEDGCTGAQLAERTGLPLWRVTALEEGRLDVDYESLAKVADALGTSLEEVVERAGAINETQAEDA